MAVIEPAAVGSAFVANAGVDRDALLADADAGAYAPALSAYLERTAGAFAAAQSPEDAAQVIVGSLDAEQLPFRIQTSEAARRFVATKLADIDGSTVTGFTRTWVS
ncbi:hypothetical protein [Schumannella soli]|uniref:hypothetical protein n=1 Tax=Schumannella soli TaxID=2590779 RepID=UPI002102FEC9|nr:hypothetical protein [Schumannella soli]